MKKRPGSFAPLRFAALLTLLLPQTALALRSGDDAVELNVDYVANGPVALTPPKVDPARAGELKIPVLLRADSPGSPATLSMIYELRHRYPQATFVVVSPDSEKQAKALFDRFEQPNFATAIDRTMASTRKYMGAGAIFPKAFAIDYTGKIIWDGEAADLGQMLDEFYAGTFDADRQKTIAPLLDQLQSRLRSGEEISADHTAQQILAIDPAHMPTLRMRVFMLETSGRAADAWKLIERQQEKSPKAERLYLLQMDFAARNPAYGGELGKIAVRYMENVKPDAVNDSIVAWGLLNQRPFDPVALKIAGLLVDRAQANRAAAADLGQADVWSTAALYNSRIGRLAEALAMQQNATAILRKNAPHRVESALLMEKFYTIAVEAHRAATK